MGYQSPICARVFFCVRETARSSRCDKRITVMLMCRFTIGKSWKHSLLCVCECVCVCYGLFTISPTKKKWICGSRGINEPIQTWTQSNSDRYQSIECGNAASIVLIIHPATTEKIVKSKWRKNVLTHSHFWPPLHFIPLENTERNDKQNVFTRIISFFFFFHIKFSTVHSPTHQQTHTRAAEIYAKLD